MRATEWMPSPNRSADAYTMLPSLGANAVSTRSKPPTAGNPDENDQVAPPSIENKEVPEKVPATAKLLFAGWKSMSVAPLPMETAPPPTIVAFVNEAPPFVDRKMPLRVAASSVAPSGEIASRLTK